MDLLDVIRHPGHINEYVFWINLERASPDPRGRVAKPPFQFIVKTGERVKFSDLPEYIRERDATRQRLRQSTEVAANGGLGVTLYMIYCAESATCWLERMIIDRVVISDTQHRIKSMGAVELLKRVVSGSMPLYPVQALHEMIVITDRLWSGLDKSHCT